MKFSEKLQKLRKEYRMSQEQLADHLEVSRQAVSKWESGQTYPEMDKLISICKLFQCSLDDLTNDEVHEIKKTEKERVTISKLIDEVLDTISRSVCLFRKLAFFQKVKYILELLLLIFILVLFQIPVHYIYQLGETVFMSFDPKISNVLCSIWNFVLSISYLIFAIICFYSLYKILFLDNLENRIKITKSREIENGEKIFPKRKKISSREKEEFKNSDIDLEEKRTDSILLIEKKSSPILKVLKSLISFFTKACLILIVFPFLFLFFLLIIAIIIGIYLMFQEIVYFGIFFLLFGGFLFCYLIIEIIFNIIMNHGNSSRRIAILFFISIIILGLGTGISLIEFSSFNYNDQGLPSLPLFDHEFVEQDVLIEDDFTFSIVGAYNKITYVSDSTFTNTARIQVEIYKHFNKVHFEYGGDSFYDEHHLWIISEPKIHIFNPKMREVILNSLREKKFYNYSDLERMNVTIYTSQENIDRIKNYMKTMEEEQRKRDLEDEKDSYDFMVQQYQEQILEYEKQISETEDENMRLEDEIQELRIELQDMKGKIQEYKDQLSAIIMGENE